MSDIADRIKQARVRRGLSLRKLASRVDLWLERYLQAEAVAPVPSKTFDYPAGFPRAVHDVYDPEEAAEALRQEWIVGLDPIESISHLLEDKGIRVDEIEAPEGFDACAFFSGGSDKKPVIVGRCNGIPGFGRC